MINKLFKKKNINTFVLLFIVIIVCAFLSYIIPSGVFDRSEVNGKTVIEPDSFHFIKSSPVSFLDIFRAIPNGMVQASSIIFLVLLIGGSIEVFNSTGAIHAAFSRVVSRSGNKGGPFILTVLMIIFAVLGGFLGWIEAAIPFVPLVITLVLSLGYDTMVGVAVCILGGMIGFATGPTNVYTVGIAHSIAELPMFSGFAFRFVVYIVFVGLGIAFVLKYAKKIKDNPSESMVKDIDIKDMECSVNINRECRFTVYHKLVLVILAATFLIVIFGMLRLKWNINDITSTFVLSGILAGIICKMAPSEIVELFMKGTRGVLPGAMLVGLARGVQWILTEGQITDTIIYYMSQPLAGLPIWLCAIGMFIVHVIINFFIPSGSGQAMVTMPIMIPMADLLGMSRQTATLAFQLGDGFSNIFWVSCGGLLIYLSFGRVPYSRWIKFAAPLIAKYFLLALIFLAIAAVIGYGPF